jgi:hypothetical protein
MEGMDEKEAKKYLDELNAPIDPKQARFEKNIGNWLRS